MEEARYRFNRLRDEQVRDGAFHAGAGAVDLLAAGTLDVGPLAARRG
jgi:hypothetical protein